MMTPENKDEIVQKLMERIGTLECPMCKKHHFTLVDGYAAHYVQKDLKTFSIGGGNVLPTIIMVCNNCGFVSQYALGALGLLNDTQDSVNTEEKHNGIN